VRGLATALLQGSDQRCFFRTNAWRFDRAVPVQVPWDGSISVHRAGVGLRAGAAGALSGALADDHDVPTAGVAAHRVDPLAGAASPVRRAADLAAGGEVPGPDLRFPGWVIGHGCSIDAGRQVPRRDGCGAEGRQRDKTDQATDAANNSANRFGHQNYLLRSRGWVSDRGVLATQCGVASGRAEDPAAVSAVAPDGHRADRQPATAVQVEVIARPHDPGAGQALFPVAAVRVSERDEPKPLRLRICQDACH
jgi:hypothetical protein